MDLDPEPTSRTVPDHEAKDIPNVPIAMQGSGVSAIQIGAVSQPTTTLPQPVGSGVPVAPTAPAAGAPPGPAQPNPNAPPSRISAPAASPAPPVSPPAPAVSPPVPPASPDRAKSAEAVWEAVGVAMTAAAAPSFIVEERDAGDLVLARTLLSGVLAAVGSAVPGLGWAVSVMRGPGGVCVFLTSNEGRGWLPAGLWLPPQVSVPWVWGESFDRGGLMWEGVSDPARVLVEFGAAWGAKSGARLSALVSSQDVDAVRAWCGDVPVERSVAGSAEEMDLGSPSAGFVDRLGVVASPPLSAHIEGVADDAVRQRCVELAWDAHTRVQRAARGAEGEVVAAVRERILTAVRTDRDVPDEWWDELLDSDNVLAASMLSRRVDVSQVELGRLRADPAEGMALRGMVFERRSDELVLLLAAVEPSRQILRDAVYAYGQIMEHPLFPSDIPAAGRPIITAGPQGG